MSKPRLDEDRGVAKGRSSVAGHRWPHAQIEVTVAKRDLGTLPFAVRHARGPPRRVPTCPLKLRIGSSIQIPIHTAVCLPIPGPAECAKRLNNYC